MPKSGFKDKAMREVLRWPGSNATAPVTQCCTPSAPGLSTRR